MFSAPSKYLNIFLIVLTFSTIAPFKNFSQELTLDEKLQDFEVLFNVLKDNYPYFGISERKTGINWLENKEAYLKNIKATKNDKEYFNVVSTALKDLRNGHTDVLPTLQRDYFINTYTNLLNQSPHYQFWLSELEKGSDKYAKLFGVIPIQEQKNKVLKKNIHFEELIPKQLFYIKILSFDNAFVESDKETLKRIIQSAKKCANVILDIQDNSGGDSRYWQQNIVPYFIKDTIIYYNYIGCRKGDITQSYLSNLLNSKIRFNEVAVLPALPQECNPVDFDIHRSTNKILPRSNQAYFGKIFLLVNDKVFSSAEAFAAFCKNKKWATVVGDTTAGDGVGFDPLLFTLPKSKITIRFPGEMGLNPDGAANAEFGTAPDTYINASHAALRVKKFLSINFPGSQNKFSLPWLTPGEIFPIGNFVIVYPTKESTDSLNNNIFNYVKKVNNLFYKLPDSLLIPDTSASLHNLKNHNIIFYGSIRGNTWFKTLATSLPFKINTLGVSTVKSIKGTDLIAIGSCFNPMNLDNYVVYYISQHSNTVLKSNSIPCGSNRFTIANSNGQILFNSNP